MDKETQSTQSTQSQSSNKLVQPKNMEEFQQVVVTFMTDENISDHDVIQATLWLKMKVDRIFKGLFDSLPPELKQEFADLLGLN